MVPIYALESWLALRFRGQVIVQRDCLATCAGMIWCHDLQALWLETLRETYEAYVIYSFFKVWGGHAKQPLVSCHCEANSGIGAHSQLMVEFLGGEEGLQRVLDEKVRHTVGAPCAGNLLDLTDFGPWAGQAGGPQPRPYAVAAELFEVVRLVIREREFLGELPHRHLAVHRPPASVHPYHPRCRGEGRCGQAH
jgi:hypothetical protein